MHIRYKNTLQHKDFLQNTGSWLHSLLGKTYLSDEPFLVFITDLLLFMTAH